MEISADELLAIARKGRPNVKYALDKKRQAIGAWSDSLGRYVQVAGLLINGEWASLPFEVLVNGQPVQHEWDA